MMPGNCSRELSRLYGWADIPAPGQDLRIDTSPEERLALAGRFSLLVLDSLTALVRLTAVGSRLRLEVEYHCSGDQQCVVSLAPVPFTMTRRFRVDFDDRNRSYTDDTAVSDNRDSGDDGMERESANDFTDVFRNGLIDVGECIVQHFGSELDPYPRVPGAYLTRADLPPGVGLGDESSRLADHSSHSPFQVLETLKNGDS